MSENTSLALLNRADLALAEANTIIKAKDLMNLALTAADWLKRKNAGEEIIQKARALAFDAERKMGQMLAEKPPAVRGKAGTGRGKKAAVSHAEAFYDDTPTLKDLGVSEHESRQAQKLAQLPEKDFELVKAGKTTISRAKKTIKATADAIELKRAHEKIAEESKIAFSKICDIRHCSMKELFASGINPDCIITDPPYPEKFLSVYEELAELAKNIPLVAVMCGQSYLPEIMAAMTKHLLYRWTLAYLTPGGQAVQQWKAKVNTFWKPILLFGKSTDWIGDVCKSDVNDNDKRFHGWGQSESGMADLVDRLSKPGHLICDPFVGGGTTAIVTIRLGRKFIGCDIDKASAEKATQRCEVDFASH